jgi:hypothetical protein
MDRFLIGYTSGDSSLQTDLKPYAIADEAFAELDNAYVFRGRVRKRFGSRWLANSQLLSRFRIQVGTIDTPTVIPGAVVIGRIGQMFSAGDQLFTVYQTGTPAAMLHTGVGTGTYNTTTGAFVLSGTGLGGTTPIYYYPSLPVMGLLTYEQGTIGQDMIIGFDTQFSYQYTTGWQRITGEVTPGASIWTGNNSQFFWGTTWTGANAFNKIFFVTNFNQTEPNFMRFYDGTNWDNFEPQIDATPNFLISARIIVPFKNRLVVFNTWEGPNTGGANNYQNRCRYSQVGSPLASDAWRQDIPGKGNAIDCPTTEAIVTVEFVKDRLIVFFDSSTWELVYTGNQAYPFIWQQINTELGAESTFSIVPFDKVCIGVGNLGIHACNGSNVERIDSKIPDAVFDIHNVDQGVFRVYGIRDYFVEMVYWTFPDDQTSSAQPYPNRVLVYNYKTGSWAFNDDSITAFGYYQPQDSVTWDSLTVTWDDDISWNSGELQSRFRSVIAGNQEGYTFIIEPGLTTNASVLQITNITNVLNTITVTIIDHNLRLEDYVYISGVTGSGNITLLNNMIFQVINPITPNTFTFIYQDDASNIISGTYSGGGVISRVSNINVTTKEYNFYAKQGRNAYIPKVDFLVDSTADGQIQVDFYVSSALTPLLQDSAGTRTLVGTGTLDTFPYTAANGTASPIPFEETAQRLWHPVFFQADGEFIQLQLTMNDEQMRNVNVRDSGFQLHAVCIYAQPTSSRFQ